MDVESLAKQLILQNMTPEQQKAVLDSVRATLQEARGKQKQRVSENVGMVVDALKKIEADIRAKYDDLGNKITARVNSIRDGRDGANGSDGRDGQDGRPGRDGAPGPAGPAGRDGANGIDGKDGVSVTDAKIDFDGSLIISLSNGREINVGEVVAPDVAEKIRVLTYGGGNSGGNGTSGLTYKGTWNASTNTPTLISSSGTNGDYYIVSVAGTTDLNGITDWQVGDWVIFNGTAWQKIDQSWATAGANNNITSMTGITGGISSPDFVQFDTGATVTNAAGRLYWDATQQTLTVGLNANIAADIGQTLYAYVTNDEAVTITKGQPVYMYAAQGDRVSVKLAYNTGDATSAKTLGVCAENIAAGQAGMVLCQGVQDGLDLSAYNPGDTLYLGATAGTLTSTKPYAPNHLVYIGVVERANAGNGRLYVRVQNGYEMDELHNVSAQNPSNGQVLIYNASTSLWEKNTLTDGTGITITEGAGSITIANAGVTSAVAGTGVSVSSSTGAVTITNTAPDQTVALTGAGTTSITGTYPNFTVTSNDQYTGTVTSVGGTGTVNGLSLSGTVTSSGSLTLGGTLSGTASININGTVGATTPAAGTFTDLTANNSAVISVNTSSDALRITQVGTGNALLIEDSTNPDSTPIVVDQTGLMVLGATANQAANLATGNAKVQILGGTAPLAFYRDADSSTAINLEFAKKRTTGGVLLTNDIIGRLYFSGNDGTTAIPAAYIDAAVDGTPGTNDMPGRLVFSTTADGEAAPTERMRIDSAGKVGIGTSAPAVLAHVQSTTATTNAVTQVLRLDSQSSGTPANGIGVGMQFSTETAAGNTEIGATIEAITTDVTATSEDFDLSFKTMAAGAAAAERARIKSTGDFQFNSGYGSVVTAYGCRAWVNFDGSANTNLSGTYSQSGTTVTVTATAHGLIAGSVVFSDITTGTAVDGTYTVATVTDANTFTYTAGTSLTTSGNITLVRNTIRGSGNVSSVADNGVGVYTVNFSSSLVDANYSTCANAGPAPATTNYSLATYYFGGTYSTAAVQIATYRQLSGAPTATDYSIVSVAVFR